MLARSPRSIALLVSLLLVARASSAAAKCDTAANASSLQRARSAIDATCPCGAAPTAGAHAKCAKFVVTGRMAMNAPREDVQSRGAEPREEVDLRAARRAAVCCRVKPSTEKTSHRVVRDPANARARRASRRARASLRASRRVRRDGLHRARLRQLRRAGRACDVPSTDVCDTSCQIIPCEPPVGNCGNGALDPGEACEPPGAGACGWNCQPATCAAAGLGEIALACVSGAATVGAGRAAAIPRGVDQSRLPGP